MAKYYGSIGYAETIETSPGVWINRIIERNSYGDVIRNTSRNTPSSESTNDDLSINNQFSIVADAYANKNFHSIKYVEFMGTKWKVTSVDVQPPRLILSLGGIYNG